LNEAALGVPDDVRVAHVACSSLGFATN
jgi:hypothetical protein